MSNYLSTLAIDNPLKIVLSFMLLFVYHTELSAAYINTAALCARLSACTYPIYGTALHSCFTTDVDECQRGDCSHYCSNTPGSFVCSCREGFYLSADGRTCFGRHCSKQLSMFHDWAYVAVWVLVNQETTNETVKQNRNCTHKIANLHISVRF